MIWNMKFEKIMKRGNVEMQRIQDIQKFAWKFNILRYSDGLMSYIIIRPNFILLAILKV